ncbi:hypothetical protein [Pseudarthrobacter sp. C4D7]|uniref:hypothetical protein n=1 Tax=Pseudarthrobacter sp. C4D7 TaxID=2735268 RepID=UPI001585A45C|nr:hypothetical protein [Pseudarthrobacter sp. C4D7]NUT72361.1 hypothetical protein [Pseudarthrobacter sp. C4D7]
MTNSKRTPKSFPVILLLIGILAGVATAVAIFYDATTLTVVLGTLIAVAAIVLTFIIALNQNADTDDLLTLVQASRDLGEKTNQVLADVQSVLLKVEEQTATRDYSQASQPMAEGSPSEEEELEDLTAVPAYADEAVAQLRSRKANLNFDDLIWRPKSTYPVTRGNHGWFVESESGNGERWFVRKANGLTVRKAMPREFLDTLEEKAPLDPREIKHDFQLTDHGLAAWYARTYSGDLWKVSKSNRNASAGITVTREESEE